MKKIISYIPITVNANFLRFRKLMYAFYAILFIGTIALLMTRGLNFGIDFTGGIVVEIRQNENISIEQLRTDLEKFDPELQTVGTDMISIRLPAGNDTEEVQMGKIKELKSILPANTEYLQLEMVGPKVGKDLIKDGIMAFLLTLLAISLYVWVRFELPFGVGAMISTFADVFLVIGFFALTGLTFSLVTLAAVLTIAGYSINDTVVIYDRIRENLKKYKTRPVREVLDLSMNEMVARTIGTGLTTMLAVGAIAIWGGAVLQSFSYAILFGVIMGTVSSIYIAVPTLLSFKLRD